MGRLEMQLFIGLSQSENRKKYAVPRVVGQTAVGANVVARYRRPKIVAPKEASTPLPLHLPASVVATLPLDFSVLAP